MPILTVESNCLAAASHPVSHVAPVHKLSGAEHYQRTGRDSKYDSALMALLDTMFFQTGKEVQASFFFGYRSGYGYSSSGESMNKNKCLVHVFLFNV